MNILQIAQVCHETNRAFCATIGDDSQKPWNKAAQWQRKSAVQGVQFTLENPSAPESAQHEAWMRDKAADGWRYGAIKNPSLKEHPCMVPYNDLPIEQRLKDFLFRAIVKAFVSAGQINIAA